MSAGQKIHYRKDVAFIDREHDLAYLEGYIADKPESILFLHGPKSSGKTTLIYRFFDKANKEERLDVKFINLRKVLLTNYRDFLQVFFKIDYGRQKEDIREKREYDLKVFKLSVETLKGMENKELDPFVVMETELLKLVKKGIKPVIIIDELQALDEIYLNGGRRLITEIFNFFVAMTKESHLAHIIIASSDGYFLETVYTDSRLKKSSRFYEINYLSHEDVMEWLGNIEKYSGIRDYTLNQEEAERIWEVVGGSMWEIQTILSDLFSFTLEEVLEEYKLKARGVIVDYIKADPEKEKILQLFLNKSTVSFSDVRNVQNFKELLRDLVKNNILYYDPTRAVFYPQGKSLELGISLYFQENT